MIGEKMKAAIKAANENQYTASEKLGVSQGGLNLWLNGKRNPTPEDIKKFCEVFHTTPNFLFGFEEISEQDKALLAAVKSLATPKKTENNPADTAKQATIPTGKEQER